MPRVRHLAALLVTALLACADEDGPAQQLGEGWSGSPAAEPAELGMPCDDEWFPCVEGTYCATAVESDTTYCRDFGTCVAMPDSCEPGPPSCGCDGMLHKSACAAAMAGVSAIGARGCEPPPGQINCGPEFCDLESHYCRHRVAHGTIEEWACVPFDCPAGLSGCACITAPSPCGDPETYGAQYCEPTPEGGSLLTCIPY